MTSVAKSNRPARSWALIVPLGQAAAVTALRLLRGIEVAIDGEVLWLRSRSADETVFAATRALPATARYEWAEDDLLKPEGAILPVRRLPVLQWCDLRQWACVALPIANVPAALPAPALIRAIPSHVAVEANALLVPLAPFLEWAEQGPVLRLERLRFAANPAGAALVLGTPLPPLPGRFCVETDGIVVPAGLALHPIATAAVLRRVLNAPSDAIVFWDEAGPRILSAESFVPLRRSAARLTRSALRAS